MPASFVLPSFAKINLALEVLDRRVDGFHELRTIYQTVDLCDSLTFAPEARGISLRVEGADLGPEKSNLVYRAALALAASCGVSRGARLTLTKRIPTGSGMGGGSSNAAVTLLGLARLWKLKVGLEQLFPLAAELGSDVPFFLTGGTSLGLGRGEQIVPLRPPSFRWLVVVDPQIHIATPQAYALLRRPLTSPRRAGRISRLCLLLSTGPWGTARGFNDFEPVVFRKFPRIREAREVLLEHGALAAQMSGSGSAVFGIFPDRNRARKALSRIEQHPWKAYLVKTVDQASYRRALMIASSSG